MPVDWKVRRRHWGWLVLLVMFWKFQHFNLVSNIFQKLIKPLPCHKSIGKMLHAICISAVAVSLRWASCGLWASCFFFQRFFIFMWFVSLKLNNKKKKKSECCLVLYLQIAGFFFANKALSCWINIKLPCPLLIFSQSYYLNQVAYTNSHT